MQISLHESVAKVKSQDCMREVLGIELLRKIRLLYQPKSNRHSLSFFLLHLATMTIFLCTPFPATQLFWVPVLMGNISGFAPRLVRPTRPTEVLKTSKVQGFWIKHTSREALVSVWIFSSIFSSVFFCIALCFVPIFGFCVMAHGRHHLQFYKLCHAPLSM